MLSSQVEDPPLQRGQLSLVRFDFDNVYVAVPLGHELSFDERFKHVLPVTEKPLNKLYEDLITIKRNVRDVIVHGFNSEQALKIMVKAIGLIPVSRRPNNLLETYFFPD